MDDFIDQILLTTPHWAETSNITSGMDRTWDINVTSIMDRSSWDIAATNHGSILIDSIQDVPKLPTIPLVQFANPGSLGSQGLVAVGNNGSGSPQAAVPSYQYSAGQPSSPPIYDAEFQDALLASTNAEEEHSTPHCISFPPRTLTACITPTPIGSTSAAGQPLHLGGARGSERLVGGMEACEFQSASLASSSLLVAPMWHQAYTGRGVSGGFCQQDVQPIETNLGKRRWDNGDSLTATTQAAVTSHPGQMQLTSSLHENQSSGSPVGNRTAKPRARARRGQATDPHSIAERNRRERIAERMKALQELVPDANKTDKASMLDEIIAYIKFLQMQVKCLSVCRLGSAGTAASLISDLTDKLQGMNNFTEATLGQSSGAMGSMQDGLCFVESQVASLMDKDMSAAMQYLQSKGLCLMPISLASAISSKTPMQQCGTSASPRVTDEDEIEKQLIEASSSLPCNNGHHYTIRAAGTCGKSTAAEAPSHETCTKPAGKLNQDTER